MHPHAEATVRETVVGTGVAGRSGGTAEQGEVIELLGVEGMCEKNPRAAPGRERVRVVGAAVPENRLSWPRRVEGNCDQAVFRARGAVDHQKGRVRRDREREPTGAGDVGKRKRRFASCARLAER